MATLQKIRDKSTLLLIVVGLALLIFIVGDALQSGNTYFSASRNKIAEIAGKPITVNEYRERVAKNMEILKTSNNLTSLDNKMVNQIKDQTWQEMISDIILGSEYAHTGIDVSDNEIAYLIHSGTDPFVNQFFNNASPSQISQWVVNIDNGSPQDKASWELFKKYIRQQNSQTKYFTLIQKSLKTPKVLIQQLSKADDKLMELKYIKKGYETVPDTTIVVSKEEIKQFYKIHKEQYKQEDSRVINYIKFPILPSPEDFENAKKKVEQYKEDFKIAENNYRFIKRTSDTPFDNQYYTKYQMDDEDIANFAFDNSIGDVFGPIFKDNIYTLTKITDSKLLPDSVRARHILIKSRNKSRQQVLFIVDSIENLLNKPNFNFEKIARQFSEDEGTATNSGDLGWFGPFSMIRSFSDTSFNAKIGEIKKVSTEFGVHFIQVTHKSKLVKKVQLATLNLKVTPSQQTYENVWTEVSKFVEKITNPQDFKEMAIKENKQLIPYTFRKSTKEISDLPNSIEIIKQAFRADDEKIFLKSINNNSPIFEFDDNYVVAMLMEINEKGYTPINKLNDKIKADIRKDKKFNQLTEELSPIIVSSSTIEEIAEKSGLNVHDLTDISVSSNQTGELGHEPKVIAVASMLEEGKVSDPIKGNAGLYIVSVTEYQPRFTDNNMANEIINNQQSNLTFKTRQIYETLLENADIVDNRHNF